MSPDIQTVLSLSPLGGILDTGPIIVRSFWLLVRHSATMQTAQEQCAIPDI